MVRWKDLTKDQREYVGELRKDGWSLHDALVQAACCGRVQP